MVVPAKAGTQFHLERSIPGKNFRAGILISQNGVPAFAGTTA
jgi:hypothetical protein